MESTATLMTGLPDTMTAAYITELGPVSNIRVGRLPVPRLGPTDVLIRAETMAANHVDTFVRSGAYPTRTPFPFVIGRDVVGTVVAIGEGAPQFAVGDTVWSNSLGVDGRQGTYAQYVAASVDRVYRLPDGPVGHSEAVATLHAAATAHIGLFREARLSPGETMLVGGAGGGVGSAVVQLAVAAGARVVATASAGDADWCRARGASAMIDYHDPDAWDQIAAIAPDGIDVYWDTSGHHDFEATVPLLATGGRIVLAAGMDATPVLPVGMLYTKDASIRGFAISNAGIGDLSSAARMINRMLAVGSLRMRVSETIPLADAARVHQLLEYPSAEAKPGRIVVVP